MIHDNYPRTIKHDGELTLSAPISANSNRFVAKAATGNVLRRHTPAEAGRSHSNLYVRPKVAVWVRSVMSVVLIVGFSKMLVELRATVKDECP
jgi:hypothetical protein